MKQLLAVLTAVAAMAASPASAQEVVLRPDFLMDLHIKSTASRDFRLSGNPLETREAARFADAAGVDCRVIDAGVVTRTDVLAYEVACDHDLGWMVIRRADQTYSAYDCLALEASAKAINKGRKIATCRLKSNVGLQTAGLQTLATRAGLPCKVVDGEFRGFGGNPEIARYEVRCKEETGFVIDSPTLGSRAELAIAPCDIAFTIGFSCTLRR